MAGFGAAGQERRAQNRSEAVAIREFVVGFGAPESRTIATTMVPMMDMRSFLVE
jgi:hypothetical protein